MHSPLQPVLTLKALKDAYEALRNAKSVADSPLLGFVLVQSRFNTPGASHDENTLHQIVFDLLVDTAVNALARLRSLYGLPLPDLNLPYEDAIADLQRDGSYPSGILRGASAVYYRYVRADLELTFQKIGVHLREDERNLRRYVQRFWRHLFYTFIHLELEARQRERQIRCQLALPSQSLISLETQETVIQRGYHHLTGTEPKLLMIYGVPGVGKSTIAMRLGEMLLKTHLIGDAVWINLQYAATNRYATSDTLAGLVCDALHLIREEKNSIEAITGYLGVLQAEHQKLLIVFDGADGWGEAFRDATNWLGHCVIIVTARTAFPLWRGTEVQCPLLTPDDTLTFLEFLGSRLPYSRKIWTDDLYTTIWQTLGGNPGAIKQACRLLEHLPLHASLSRSHLSEFYRSTWQQLETISCRLWLILDLLGVFTPVAYRRLTYIASMVFSIQPHEVDSSLLTLVQTGLIEAILDENGNYFYSVPMGMREAISDAASAEVARLVECIVTCRDLPTIGELAFTVLQATAYHSLIREHLAVLARQAHYHVATRGQWEGWLQTMERCTQLINLPATDYLRLELEAVSALRWLGVFNQALERVERVIIELRKTDDMVLLAEALIEKSRLLLYQNRAQHALTLAQDAHTFLESIDAPDLLEESKVAILRALSQLDARRAHAWVSKISRHDAAIWGVITQLEIRLGNKQVALLAARRCVESQTIDDPGYARSLGVLAETLLLNGDIVESIRRYQQAINLLQRKQDIVGLARMYNNYGAALMETRNFKGARRQFLTALNLHEKLQDTHGRMIAEGNLHLIDALMRGGSKA